MTDGQPLCRSFFQNGSEEPSASRMAALMAELISQSERAAEWQEDAWEVPDAVQRGSLPEHGA